MKARKVLFISGSLGLGHITRDLAIAAEIRRQVPGVAISWLASDPATRLIRDAGEDLLPEADLYSNDNIPAENAAKGTHLNLLRYLTKASKGWKRNFEIFKYVTDTGHFDLCIGDETYELDVGLQEERHSKKAPFVMIFDFIGLDAVSNNPIEKLGVYMWNRIWSKDYKYGRAPSFDLGLFVGEEQDVPDKKFGFMLPNRLEWAKALCNFVGYILSFDPSEYTDKAAVRAKLGYGKEPVIICSIGGTAVGKRLLELCGQAYKFIRDELPGLRMILVCGPRLAAKSLNVPQEVEIREYIPPLYEHFAASDLAIVQGGATSTLELTALRRPFLYFPLEGHFEQAHVAELLTKRGAGVRMSYSKTTPVSLAKEVMSNIGKKVSYRPISTDGAQRAAQLISHLLDQ